MHGDYEWPWSSAIIVLNIRVRLHEDVADLCKAQKFLDRRHLRFPSGLEIKQTGGCLSFPLPAVVSPLFHFARPIVMHDSKAAGKLVPVR